MFFVRSFVVWSLLVRDLREFSLIEGALDATVSVYLGLGNGDGTDHGQRSIPVEAIVSRIQIDRSLQRNRLFEKGTGGESVLGRLSGDLLVLSNDGRVLGHLGRNGGVGHGHLSRCGGEVVIVFLFLLDFGGSILQHKEAVHVFQIPNESNVFLNDFLVFVVDNDATHGSDQIDGRFHAAANLDTGFEMNARGKLLQYVKAGSSLDYSVGIIHQNDLDTLSHQLAVCVGVG